MKGKEMNQGKTCKPVLSMKDVTEVYCDTDVTWDEAALILREKLLKEMRDKCERLEREIEKLREGTDGETKCTK